MRKRNSASREVNAQLSLFRQQGGARKGAGRPKAGGGVLHRARPKLSRHHPAHVTLRVAQGLESLRNQGVCSPIRSALRAARERFGFRLVQFSVQSNHIHLLVEAEDRTALTRGMQGLAIRISLAVNGVLARRGRVFAERYHALAARSAEGAAVRAQEPSASSRRARRELAAVAPRPLLIRA